MILTGVRVRNWKRYRGEHTVELTGGIYALVARDAENPDRSNWLGKSSFIEAVWYGLEGEVPSDDTVDSVVSHGEDAMDVDLAFDDGTFVCRSRDVKRSKSTFHLTVPDGKGGELELVGDAAQAELDQRIGMGKKDLRATCFIRQKQMAKLLTDDPADVTAVINGWLSLAPVEKAAAAQSKIVGEVEAVLERAAARHNAALAALSGMPPEAELRAEEKRLLAIEEENRVAFAERAKQAEAREARAGEIAAWEAATERQLRRGQAERDVVTAEQAQRAYLQTAPDDQRLVALQGQLEECVRAEAEARAAEQRARPMAAGAFDGTCPVAGIDCPAVVVINGMRREGRARLETARGAAATAQERVQAARAAVTPCQAAARRRGELAAAVDARKAVLARTPWQPDPGLRPEEIPAGPSLFDTEPVTNRLAEVKARLMRRAELEKEAAVGEREEVVARDEAAVQRAGLKVLRGALRVIAQRACLVLEHGANARLASAGVDLRVGLDWGWPTQVLEVTCSSCGLAFPKSARVKKCERCQEPRGLKSDEKFHVRLSNKSGAAEDLAGVAIQLAAASWLRTARGGQWSVLVLDEPTSAMDRHNRAGFVANLRAVLGVEWGQAFVVSHDEQVLAALPQRIEIVAEGKWSKVSVAT